MTDPNFPETPKYQPIPGRRRVLYQVHPLTIVYEILLWVRRMAFPLAIFLYFSFTGGGNDDSSVFEIVLSALAGLKVVFVAINYMISRWGFEENVFVWKTGVIQKQERNIPMDRIQNVEVERNLAHRMLGLADLKIDTGVGGEAEVRLSALGLEDAQQLQRELLKRRVGQFEVGPDPSAAGELKPTEALWTATPRDLVYAGLSENRALFLVGSIFGLFSFFQFGSDSMERAMLGAVRNVVRSWDSTNYWPIFWGGIALFIVGAIAGIFNAFIRFHGFTITHRGDRIVREYGLFTHYSSAIPLRRVQVFTAAAGWVKRLLGFWSVECATAGSVIDLEQKGSNVLCPVVPTDQIGRFVRLIFPDLYFDRAQWKKVSRLTIRRHFVSYMLVWLMAFGAGVVPFGPWVLLGLIPAAGISVCAAFRYWETVGYARYGGHTLVHTGLVSQKIYIVPDGKVQSLSLTQSPFQRRGKIANLTIVTAGHGLGGSIEIVDMPFDEATRLHDELKDAAGRLGAWQIDGV